MSNEITTVANPFKTQEPAQSKSVLGSVLQTKAAAEVQAAVFLAKQFPRDQVAACDRILNACQRSSLAKNAMYEYNRGGSVIKGPSIKLVEVIAANWGNIQYGTRELERNENESVMQAYAWDLETNTHHAIEFVVPHKMKAKGDFKTLDDPRDIYENVANMGSRRVRACILRVIPSDVVESAVDQCNKTLKASVDITDESMKILLAKFKEFNISKSQIEKRIQRRFETIQPGQWISLRSIYASLIDGMSVPEDWFQPEESEEVSTAASVVAQAAKKATKKDQSQPEESPSMYDMMVNNIQEAKDIKMLEGLKPGVDTETQTGEITQEQGTELKKLIDERIAAFNKSK